jgi:hypothetical protein
VTREPALFKVDVVVPQFVVPEPHQPRIDRPGLLTTRLLNAGLLTTRRRPLNARLNATGGLVVNLLGPRHRINRLRRLTVKPLTVMPLTLRSLALRPGRGLVPARALVAWVRIAGVTVPGVTVPGVTIVVVSPPPVRMTGPWVHAGPWVHM